MAPWLVTGAGGGRSGGRRRLGWCVLPHPLPIGDPRRFTHLDKAGPRGAGAWHSRHPRQVTRVTRHTHHRRRVAEGTSTVLVVNTRAPTLRICRRHQPQAGRGQAGAAAVASFSFKVPSLGPYESKEGKDTVHSNLRAYERPTGSSCRRSIEITSPPAVTAVIITCWSEYRQAAGARGADASSGAR